MTGFYGGLNGQDFSVKKVFSSRHQMEMDLNNGWTSSISVGEFVVISYGLPNEPGFDVYRNEDMRYYNNKTYNSTLWQKVYDETEGRTANGLKYKLIASMTGNTPKIIITEPTTILHANEDPKVELNDRDIDHPILTFKLPRSQVLSIDYPCGILDCNESPEVVMDDSNIDYPILYFALPQAQVIDKTSVSWLNVNQNPTLNFNKTDINRPILEFSLPVAQNLQEGTTTVLNANQSPSFDIDKTDINNPVLNFSLPQSQVIEQATVSWLNVGQKPTVNLNISNINRPILEFNLPVAQSLKKGSTTVLNANVNPSFDIDFSNINEPVLNFSLPQSQVMANPSVTIGGPLINPNVVINNNNINRPKLEFTLPRAVRFYYGSLLGERKNSPYEIENAEFANYSIGDYYINAPTGFIYQITQKNENTCQFTYVACIQSPLPQIDSVGINPFIRDDSGNLQAAEPTVTRSFINNEETAWQLDFKLPKAPVPDASYEFIGSEETGAITVAPSAEDKIKFNFKIPRGSKMYAGLEIEGDGTSNVSGVTIDGAKIGDLFLNTKTGIIYKLNSSKIWEFQGEGLKGSVGDALNVVRNYRIVNADDFNVGVNYIKAHYVDESGNALPYKSDELFGVTFVDETKGLDTAYWYFYSSAKEWGRVQLTGGVANLIINTYTPSTSTTPVTNRAYSIDYINKLIGGEATAANENKTTFSKKQINALLSWGTMEEAIDDSWWPTS